MAAAVAKRNAKTVAATYAVAGWSLGGAVALRMVIDFSDAVPPCCHAGVVAALSARGRLATCPPRRMRWSCCAPAGFPATTGTLAQFFELNMAGKFRDHADALAALAVKRPPCVPGAGAGRR